MIKILAVGLIVVLVGLVIISQQGKEKEAQNAPEAVTESNTQEDSSDELGTTERTENTESAIGNNQALDLSGKGLSSTPNSVFDNRAIQELDLSNNNLSGSLPAEVRLLQNLKVLDISNNQFTGVPAEIGQLKNLEVLNLSSNQITGLPYELGNLPNLKVLDLRGNNYASSDLEIIMKTLPSSTQVLTD